MEVAWLTAKKIQKAEGEVVSFVVVGEGRVVQMIAVELVEEASKEQVVQKIVVEVVEEALQEQESEPFRFLTSLASEMHLPGHLLLLSRI